MIRSMTGYGKGEVTVDDKTFTVEVKTVNHKYSEISLRTPKLLNSLESKIREYLKNSIFRGKIDVFIKYTTNGLDSKKLTYDEQLAEGYYNILSKMKEKFNLNDNINLSLLTRFPDIITVDNDEEDEEIIWSILEKSLEQAMKNLVEMREKEGEALKQDIIYRLNLIKEAIKHIEQRSPIVVEEYREKLNGRIKELMKDTVIDEQRIAMEVAIMSDRSNITEEIIRLYSHIDQSLKALSDEESVGKKLNFIVQEMHREANTIGSKTTDMVIINKILEVKSEVEKIREQIQNIE